MILEKTVQKLTKTTISISDTAEEPLMWYDEEFRGAQATIGAITSMIKSKVEADKAQQNKHE